MKGADPLGGQLQRLPQFRAYPPRRGVQFGVRDAKIVPIGPVQQPGVTAHRYIALAPHLRQHPRHRFRRRYPIAEGRPRPLQRRFGQGRQIQRVNAGQDIFGVFGAPDDVQYGGGGH